MLICHSRAHYVVIPRLDRGIPFKEWDELVELSPIMTG